MDTQRQGPKAFETYVTKDGKRLVRKVGTNEFAYLPEVDYMVVETFDGSYYGCRDLHTGKDIPLNWLTLEFL